MRRIAIIFAGIALFAAARPVSAQGFLDTGGLMANKDVVTPSDLFELSQTQFNFGTARSMAMAGAFTSLGADLSSMSINPAGLGMYRRSDISMTPMMSFAHAKNSAQAWDQHRNTKNQFSLGNIGFAIPVYQGQGALTSLTIGFGYTRLADLNYAYSMQQTGNVGSIADMYSMQMRYSGFRATDVMGDNLKWGNVPTDLWPAVLGYKCGLTDDPNNDKQWSPTWIGSGVDIGQYASVVSRGSTGEYVISAGANLGNKFYIGGTLGIQSIYQVKDYYYAEDYAYANGTAPDLDYQLLWAKLNQTVIVNGSGVNFKLGMIYRPTQNLRIGAAFHTPTYYSFSRKYQSAMASSTFANRDSNPDISPDPQGYLNLSAETPVLMDNGPDSWSFAGPSRLFLGGSYTFGTFGVLSVDYERAWYNGIRMKDTPGNLPQEMYNNTFRTTFKGSNTVRVGLEVRPLPTIALRAGFGYSGSWLRDTETIMGSPIDKQITYYSAGIGFNLSRKVVLDLAYSYQSAKQTDYHLYYADEYTASGDLASVNASDIFSTTINRHNAAITLGIKF